MMYPLNLFGTDPASNSVRPFIIFIANEYKPDIMKAKSWSDALPMAVPKGGFALPMPNGGLVDAVTHDYSPTNPLMDKAISTAAALGDAAMGGIDSTAAVSMATGYTPDPMMTQVYKGTGPRKWSGTWQIIPQSMAESAMVALILKDVKKFGSPDRLGKKGKPGMLIQPYVFKIVFSNPLIHLAMQFDKMAIESYSINYFAQGYASTYKDMMPKHIELTMSFAEFGIKYREDW